MVPEDPAPTVGLSLVLMHTRDSHQIRDSREMTFAKISNLRPGPRLQRMAQGTPPLASRCVPFVPEARTPTRIGLRLEHRG